jgi:Ca2+-binding RTX toxin-like protein
MVVDQVISSESNSYTGTAEADVFALAEGSAQITSGAGEDVFIFAPGGNEADVSGMHNITDFESGADTIDITAAMMAVGYTETDGLTQMMSADMSADILDLINGNDGSLDNMFGASFDNASNLLTVFADTNPEQGMAQVDSYQIELGEDSTFEDDDMTVNFTSFIA